MKFRGLFILFAGLMLVGGNAFKAADEKQYLLCIVHGNYTAQQGQEMAKAFKEKYPVTSLCRLDAVSKKFFIVFDSEKISRDNVIDFFAARQYKATCLHTGIYGKDPVPDVTAAECK